jgi:hypothetical protein
LKAWELKLHKIDLRSKEWKSIIFFIITNMGLLGLYF